jgi:hypothetical protein
MNNYELVKIFVKIAQSSEDWEKIDKATKEITKLQICIKEIVSKIPEIKKQISDLLMIFKNVEKIALNIYNNTEDDSLFNDPKNDINELIDYLGFLKQEISEKFFNVSKGNLIFIEDDTNLYFNYLYNVIFPFNIKYYDSYIHIIKISIFDQSKFEGLVLNIFQIQNGRKEDVLDFSNSIKQFHDSLQESEKKIKQLFEFFKKVCYINVDLQNVPDFDYFEFFKWLDLLLDYSIDIRKIFGSDTSSLESVKNQLQEKVKDTNLA